MPISGTTSLKHKQAVRVLYTLALIRLLFYIVIMGEFVYCSYCWIICNKSCAKTYASQVHKMVSPRGYLGG